MSGRGFGTDETLLARYCDQIFEHQSTGHLTGLDNRQYYIFLIFRV